MSKHKFILFQILGFYLCLNNSFKLVSNSKPITKFKYVGDTKPLGYFDPLKLTTKMEESEIKNLREAELQHGRLAMFSIVNMFSYEIITSKMGFNLLNFEYPLFQNSLLITFFIYELFRLNKQYQISNHKRYLDDFYTTKIEILKIKDTVEPGLIFNSSLSQNEDKLNKELNNGRLAMIGVTFYMLQESLGYRVF